MNIFFALTSINGLIIIALLILLLYVLYFYTHKTVSNKLKLDNHTEFEPKEQQFRLYFLFIGVCLIVIELILEVFKIRFKSFLWVNVPVGMLSILLYFLTSRISFFSKNISLIFIICYFSYFTIILNNVFLKNLELISYVSLVVAFFLSFFVFKNILHYWLFVITILLLLIASYNFELIPHNYTIILICAFILTIAIHTARHIALIETRNKFMFANIIVNNGNSLILTSNKKGEVFFCSDSIKPILGYDAKEALGFGFWELTEDPEFIGEAYHEDFVDDRLYIRKLKCKNGDYKYIQWKDKKYSDNFFIGIGQDVTEQIIIKNQYQDLIESATDLIYEIDSQGKLVYLNPFTEKVLGYKKEEILGQSFSNYIRNDYVKQVLTFYSELPENNNDFPDFIFPIKKRNGDDVWVSQKVILKKSENKNEVGYSAIARDITLIKKLEREHYERTHKIRTYNESIKQLTAKSYSNKEGFYPALKNILHNVANNCSIDRVSYWSYIPEGLRCESAYYLQSNRYEKHFFIDKLNYPKYFKTIETGMQIVASNVYQNTTVEELCYEYFPKNNIKMDKTQGKELLEIKNIIVNQFGQSEWLELGFYLGCNDLVQNHPRLLRSLGFGDEDYEGNVLSVLDDIIKQNCFDLKCLPSHL